MKKSRLRQIVKKIVKEQVGGTVIGIKAGFCNPLVTQALGYPVSPNSGLGNNSNYPIYVGDQYNQDFEDYVISGADLEGGVEEWGSSNYFESTPFLFNPYLNAPSQIQLMGIVTIDGSPAQVGDNFIDPNNPYIVRTVTQLLYGYFDADKKPDKDLSPGPDDPVDPLGPGNIGNINVDPDLLSDKKPIKDPKPDPVSPIGILPDDGSQFEPTEADPILLPTDFAFGGDCIDFPDNYIPGYPNFPDLQRFCDGCKRMENIINQPNLNSNQIANANELILAFQNYFQANQPSYSCKCCNKITEQIDTDLFNQTQGIQLAYATPVNLNSPNPNMSVGDLGAVLMDPAGECVLNTGIGGTPAMIGSIGGHPLYQQGVIQMAPGGGMGGQKLRDRFRKLANIGRKGRNRRDDFRRREPRNRRR